MVKIMKSDAEKLLGNVPDEYVFRCCDGSVFRNMRELHNGLATMSDESFAFHASGDKNDFNSWVRDIIKDEKLARDLLKSTNRSQAAKSVAARISFLSSKLG
jgi:predicted trehalose synthase